MPSLIVRLIWFLLRRVRARTPDYVIGGAANPYMRRWWVIPRNHYFNIYLHNVLRDDDDRALHDHPWPSVSLVLRGYIIETFQHTTWRGTRTECKDRLLRQGSVVWRGPRFAHRLSVPIARLHNNSEPSQVWTLFITGPRIREWGFLCPKRWVHWKEFTGYTEGDDSITGRGCGEQ